MNRMEKIEAYRQGYQLFVEALENIPETRWQERPDPDDWTIHEIIIHLADSEVYGSMYLRKAIGEPGSKVTGYDAQAWAEGLGYHNQATDDALELFQMLRMLNHRLLTNLPESAWETSSVGYAGQSVETINSWLNDYIEHVTEHIEQMQRIHEKWTSTQQ